MCRFPAFLLTIYSSYPSATRLSPANDPFPFSIAGIYLTLQCSHLFFTELCTFIPLTCSSSPPATKLSLRGAIAGVVLAARPSAGLATACVAETERAPKARSNEALIVNLFEGRSAHGKLGLSRMSGRSEMRQTVWLASRVGGSRMNFERLRERHNQQDIRQL